MCIHKNHHAKDMQMCDETNNLGFASSEDSDQHGYPPCLIGVITILIKQAKVLGYQLGLQQRKQKG